MCPHLPPTHTVNISFPHPVRNVFVAGCCSGFNLKDKVNQLAPPFSIYLVLSFFLTSCDNLVFRALLAHVPVFLLLYWDGRGPLKTFPVKWLPICLCQSEVTLLMFISRSTMDYITTNIVRCFQLHRDFLFIFTLVRTFVLCKLNTAMISVSLGRQPDLGCELLQQQEPFMWVNPHLSGNLPVFTSHLLWETPVWATGSLFSSYLHRKDWETRETTPGRFAESLILPGATWLTEEFLSETLQHEIYWTRDTGYCTLLLPLVWTFLPQRKLTHDARFFKSCHNVQCKLLIITFPLPNYSNAHQR